MIGTQMLSVFGCGCGCVFMLHGRLIGAYASPGVCLLEEDVLFTLVSMSMSCMLELFWYTRTIALVFLRLAHISRVAQIVGPSVSLGLIVPV